MGVPYGVGEGLDRGVKTAGTFMLEAMKIDQANTLAEQRSILALNWVRTQHGLPPMDVEDARDYLAQMTNPSTQQKPQTAPQPSADATAPSSGASAVPALALAERPQQMGRLEVPGGSASLTPAQASPAQALATAPMAAQAATPPPMKHEGINPFASGATAPRTRSTY